MPDTAETDHDIRLAPRIVAGSIVGFWTFFVLLGTIRSFIINPIGEQAQLLLLRLMVAGSSAGVTALLYRFLRRYADRRLTIRIAVAVGACVIAAAGFAVINALLYNDVPGLPLLGGPRSAAPVSVSVASDGLSEWGETLAEQSITGYFLMAAWAALYLALGYAAEVGVWERRAADLRSAAQTAELRALRYQVNPHFLFNTLNSLSALVMTGCAAEAEAMIVGLSAYFRASLAGDPTKDVTLGEEIDLQRLYLAIERQRFPDRLRLEVVMADNVEQACIPGMILQPLVENAVRHGVACAPGETVIRILAQREGDDLNLAVEDDARTVSTASAGTGVGLRNVADRLAARYGARATLRTEQRPEGGFAARLSIPLVFHGR